MLNFFANNWRLVRMTISVTRLGKFLNIFVTNFHIKKPKCCNLLGYSKKLILK